MELIDKFIVYYSLSFYLIFFIIKRFFKHTNRFQ